MRKGSNGCSVETASQMRVLTLNCGSSSIKYQLRDMVAGGIMAAGLVSRIGEEESRIETTGGKSGRVLEIDIPDHGRGLELIVEWLLDAECGALSDISEVAAVGHRVVHGGDLFTTSTLLDAEAMGKIEALAHLAPLHNPPILRTIRGAMRLLPRTPQVAVFDTAFHANMPARAYTYALPYRLYTENAVRRYGFHGISVASVAARTDRLLGGRLAESKVIIAHLGNGASITAVDGGVSVDTSMGLTPIEGLVMGTRPGDVDPGVVLFLMRDLGLSVEEVDHLLNKESGLEGLSGVSNDMREVEAGAAAGDERCRLALDVYAYRVKKYVGAYAAAMGGLDVLVFTAGVGERDPAMRAAICADMEFLGVKLDQGANDGARGTEREIGASGAPVRVLVVPTDEEGFIAEQTVAVVASL
jgi:acetate kinase